MHSQYVCCDSSLRNALRWLLKTARPLPLRMLPVHPLLRVLLELCEILFDNPIGGNYINHDFFSYAKVYDEFVKHWKSLIDHGKSHEVDLSASRGFHENAENGLDPLNVQKGCFGDLFKELLLLSCSLLSCLRWRELLYSGNRLSPARTAMPFCQSGL